MTFIMASLYVRTSLTARCASKNIQNIAKQSVDKQHLFTTPSIKSSHAGLLYFGCVPLSQLHSSPVSVLPPFGISHASFVRLASADSTSNTTSATGVEEPLEAKLQSPYHFSLSSNEEKAQDPEPVHHYHPEPYPEGVSDEKGFYEDEEEPYVDDYDEEDIKHGILEAALELVSTHGWTKAAIVAAAESYGYPGVAHGMFPGGAADLANYYYSKCNAQLRAEMEAESGEEIPSQTAFVRNAMIRRLKMTLAVKETWSEAMAAIASSPEGIQGGLKNLMELSDDIWHYAGDKSTDTNWYTKRALLAGVYKTTELYMMQDQSTDHQATWDFLDRRLSGAVEFGTAFRQQRQSAENVVGSLFGAATTFANLMGMRK